jgi:ankyrin repeat protein
VFFTCFYARVIRFINGQVDSGATAVYLACQEGHLDVARHLVAEAMASLKLRTYDGMTCVHVAAQMGHLHVIRWLASLFVCLSIQSFTEYLIRIGKFLTYRSLHCCV